MLRGQSWALLEKVYAGNTWFEGSRFWNPSMQKEYEKKTKLFHSLELIPTSSPLQPSPPPPNDYLLFFLLVFLSLRGRYWVFTYIFASRWVGRLVPNPAKAKNLWYYLLKYSCFMPLPILNYIHQDNIFFCSTILEWTSTLIFHEEGLSVLLLRDTSLEWLNVWLCL
jgi:hypothetical protein